MLRFAQLIAPLLVLLSLASSSLAETWQVTTFAGAGGAKDNGSQGQAKEVNIGQPFGVEIGPDSHVYVTEVQNHRIWRIDRESGAAVVVAGSGKKGYGGDGRPATEALLNEPYEVRFDSRGNMLFVEMQNHTIRRVDRETGVISTVAGTGEPGNGRDGAHATKVAMNQPHSIALDADDNIFVADIRNHRIRRIDAQTGAADTILGNGQAEMPQDGKLAHGQPIKGPRALAVEGDTLWIVLREGNSVWRYSLTDKTVHHVAGSGAKGMSDGEPGDLARATFNGPKGIAVGPDRRLYIVDTENQAIRVIDPRLKTMATIAGVGPPGRGFRGDDGPAREAHFARPHGLGIDSDGVVYIGDSENHRVRALRRTPE